MAANNESDTFDVVVIGGGPAGENVVDRAVRGGLSAALVEHELVGGECSYWACMPSKALLRPVELMGAVRRLPGVAEAVTGPLDVGAVLARRDKVTGRGDDSGQVAWVEGIPATLLRGHGRLAGQRRVEVSGGRNGSGGQDGRDGARVLEARHAVVVATGTRAAVPPVPGLAEARPWTSREVTSTSTVPERLVVIGGGVVACEMAQAMRGLGAREVTMLVRGPRLLGRVEPFAGELLAGALTAAGISIRTGTSPERIERTAQGGPVTVALPGGERLVADEVLVATGRIPATDDVGLESVGLSGGGYLSVDDSMRVEVVDGGWLYAVGDVNGRNLLTHMGKYQARVCGDVIAARAAGHADDLPSLRATADAVGAPQVVFTDPQVCAVGLTEEAARSRGLAVRAVEYEIGQVAGASLLADHYVGRAKMVVDERRRVVVGVTFLGPDAAELLHGATVAVVGQVPVDVLWHAVPSYPTVSEIWLRLLETYGL